jgi:hypothetical protein
LVGYADLRDLPADQRNGFNYRVSLAVALKPLLGLKPGQKSG